MIHRIIYELDNIEDIAAQVLKLSPNKTILFHGNLGAGKTTFIQAMVKNLKSEDTATSPTFGLVNTYQSPIGEIYHFDCYRIESIEEALDFGIEEYFESDNYVFIEWPENIASLLPLKTSQIKIDFLSEKERKLELEY
ncbi:MAG: tRNA (adenosine(37)-N6)-threonylcarbamoyltransferase complex ATPase subunit type 1 TsaE [Flavobacteriaceae bacterium]|nr:tRNA (adenosine(37)-N6)-threonylcarbamoyltransferase complex ATPase subunit type 1 TsaE [Flavobacteriaceae bacterium]